MLRVGGRVLRGDLDGVGDLAEAREDCFRSCGVWGSGFRVYDLCVQGLGFRVQGL